MKDLILNFTNNDKKCGEIKLQLDFDDSTETKSYLIDAIQH